MKRTIVWALVLILCGAMFAGAEDADVMPMKVGRLYLAPAFAFANGKFNDDWGYDSYASGGGALKTLNLIMAVEYGINRWITGAIQWKPGVNLWSDVDKDLKLGKDNSVNTHGVADLFLGAKMQIVGDKGPIQNETFHFSFAPGVKIPLPGPDYEKQLEKLKDGEAVTAANIDNHAFALGGRFYFDYVINKKFFINLYSEFIGYPVKQDIRKSGIDSYVAGELVRGTVPLSSILGSYSGDIVEGDVHYGYELSFEVEPSFSAPLGDSGVVFSAGLPFSYKYSPGTGYDNVALTAGVKDAITAADDAIKAATGNKANASAAIAGAQEKIDGQFSSDPDPNHMFTMTPNVSFFFTKWFLPTAFKVQYSAPLIGKNARAMHSFSLIAKIYFRI